ncbi:hypothetical protein BDK51DRAFT_50829 [Blyttiomyces helicus]|uniref:Uncharacterized protein n=1 Tax=Blyttiomyces helicus TaxID=388810 RepID=A0A4P9W7G4_9FUNG|nr:hypothetical protein BDK51DRAFT_50829 [Blyttiomyces helicus]|eukprot:RKO86968.1 hypothetical protein BDK51DRAFT_50829 [Blyttiomyces helicus]
MLSILFLTVAGAEALASGPGTGVLDVPLLSSDAEPSPKYMKYYAYILLSRTLSSLPDDGVFRPTVYLSKAPGVAPPALGGRAREDKESGRSSAAAPNPSSNAGVATTAIVSPTTKSGMSDGEREECFRRISALGGRSGDEIAPRRL